MTPREERDTNETRPARGTQNQRSPGSRDKEKRPEDRQGEGQGRRGQTGSEGSQPSRTGQTGSTGGQRDTERRGNP